MSFIDLILSFLTPYECLVCQSEGDLVCAACTQQLPAPSQRCYRCQRFESASLTCSVCRPRTALRQVRSAAAYEGAAKALILHLKFQGAQAAARRMAELMAPLLPSKGQVLVPVPTAAERIRWRGYDQATLLARELSRLTGLPCWRGLARHGRTHQVGSSRQQRQQQLHNSLQLKKPAKLRYKHVVLIDDVVTTGATLQAAARALRDEAETISAVTFGQAL